MCYMISCVQMLYTCSEFRRAAMLEPNSTLLHSLKTVFSCMTERVPVHTDLAMISLRVKFGDTVEPMFKNKGRQQCASEWLFQLKNTVAQQITKTDLENGTVRQWNLIDDHFLTLILESYSCTR